MNPIDDFKNEVAVNIEKQGDSKGVHDLSLAWIKESSHASRWKMDRCNGKRGDTGTGNCC